MLSKEGGVKTARRIAAGFENRLKEGITGKNLVELYSGIKEGQTISLFGGVYKAVAGKDFKSTVFTLAVVLKSIVSIPFPEAPASKVISSW